MQIIDDYKSDIRPDQTVSPFTDTISGISWSPATSRVFATTSWDGELRAYQVLQSNYGSSIAQRLAYRFATPALKCCWSDQGTQLFVGLMDGAIKAYDIGSGQVIDVGKHGAAITSLHFLPGKNSIISSACQSQVNIWQLGNPNPFTINAENKIYTTDAQFPILVAGTSDQRILLTDLNNPTVRTITDSSDLGKHSQIQSMALNAKGSCLGVGSVDGRANISHINKNIHGNFNTKSSITFKSNKQEENGMTVLYPINSVAFNPTNERWFMTAGSDGGMHFWDFQSKNKIKSLSYYGAPICTAKVSPTGDMIAYALGNDWHIGAEGINKWETKLGVHVIAENEKKFNK